MDILKHYIDKDMAKQCAERIRTCYDSHDKKNICCNCGDNIYCVDCPFKCDVCSTNNCCPSCNEDSSSFNICRAKFEECPTCGYMKKTCGNDVVVDLSSVDIKLWSIAFGKISAIDRFKYTYKVKGEITEEMISILNQYGISARN